MYLTVGYWITPQREFVYADYIDAELVGDWMAGASLAMMDEQSWERDGKRVSTRDLLPMAVLDPGLDRMFLANANPVRRVPDHEAVDPERHALYLWIKGLAS